MASSTSSSKSPFSPPSFISLIPLSSLTVPTTNQIPEINISFSNLRIAFTASEANVIFPVLSATVNFLSPVNSSFH